MISVDKCRAAVKIVIAGPGPGRYGLPNATGYSNHDPTKKKAPAYSFGARLENTSKFRIFGITVITPPLSFYFFLLPIALV